MEKREIIVDSIDEIKRSLIKYGHLIENNRLYFVVFSDIGLVGDRCRYLDYSLRSYLYYPQLISDYRYCIQGGVKEEYCKYVSVDVDLISKICIINNGRRRTGILYLEFKDGTSDNDFRKEGIWRRVRL